MAKHEPEEDDPYAEFLILDRTYQHKYVIPFYLTLMDSASFSDYEVDFYLNKTQQMCDHEYSVLIKGVPETFPPATGFDKMTAQNKAAEQALQIMSRRCYTVKYRSHQAEITLRDIFKDLIAPAVPPVSQLSSNNVPSKSIKIEDGQLHKAQAGQQEISQPLQHPGMMAIVSSGPDTFGSKMLKKMGWDGGGLGKDGEGIIEPIRSSLVAGRFGFGHFKRKEIEEPVEQVGQPKEPPSTGKKKKKQKKVLGQQPQPQLSLKKITDERFIHRARLVIQDFIDNSENEDLIFSSKLTGLQRKLIHDLAPGYNLTSISFGYKSNRHLVLFRAHRVDEFLERCIKKSKGNILMNFQVIPPSVLKGTS
ncbi:uncharacterized protein LOC135203128 [Macrobrachium nipponense]|uniref:uncharacterized protein LOC135203128 n=1 Tax=Macrobrachium nipponense TaxID=159736 RepID=UPI0030C7C732